MKHHRERLIFDDAAAALLAVIAIQEQAEERELVGMRGNLSGRRVIQAGKEQALPALAVSHVAIELARLQMVIDGGSSRAHVVFVQDEGEAFPLG